MIEHLGLGGFLECLKPIERANRAKSAAIENVRIDHGRAHVFMAEEFLDGADI